MKLFIYLFIQLIYFVNSQNSSTEQVLISSNYVNNFNNINLTIYIDKNYLKFTDKQNNQQQQQIKYIINYKSDQAMIISYSIESNIIGELHNNYSWFLLKSNQNFEILEKSINFLPKYLGITNLIFKIQQINQLPELLNDIHLDNEKFQNKYNTFLLNNFIDSYNDEDVGLIKFTIMVMRGKTISQFIFRLAVMLVVIIITFTMGCELDKDLMKDYLRKPIGPIIGFCCQFTIMPLIALGVAKVIPIEPYFGFGLLTVGCSPGGGSSNGWSLLLNGDLNLSTLMTFISSLCSLFMMPLLMFIFGRFFLDVKSVTIPYGNITIQLLQVALPALLGLGLKLWKPKWAFKFTKLSRPLFILFIIFFMTFGIYINLSIVSLLIYYPLIIPSGGLLPCFGFCLSALVAFILRQPRKLIITIAIETGIQNTVLAVLVLAYSIPQPYGDLSAIMPITVALITPIPLCIAYVILTIKNKCLQKNVTIKDDQKYCHTANDSVPNEDGQLNS